MLFHNQASRFAWHNKQVYIPKTLATTRAVIGHGRRNVHSDGLLCAYSILKDLPAFVR